MRAQPAASHWIAGAPFEDAAGAAFDVRYPATGETIARLHAATPAVDRARGRGGARGASPPGRRPRPPRAPGCCAAPPT